MASRSPLLPALGLVLLAGAVGVSAVLGAPPDATGVGIWPVGIASGALLATRRPGTPVIVALVGLVAFVTIWVDRPPAVAAGLAVGIAAETYVVWRILARGVRVRPSLHTQRDLARYLAASGAGAVVVGAAAVACSLGTGWGEPWLLGLAVATSSLGSQLTLTPFFCRLRPHRGQASLAERLAQWALLVVLTPVVFSLDQFPAVAYVLIPVLGWGALRSGAYVSIGQLFGMLGIAILLTTSGHGPFAHVDSRYDLPADLQGILLSLFISSCALVVVPFALSVGEQLENARQVAAERDRVQSIVNGSTGLAIIGADGQGRITLFNPGAERLLGYRADEVLGSKTRALHSEAAIREKAAELGVARDLAAIAATVVGRGPTDIKFLRKDGQERNHSMSLNRIVDNRGEVLGYVSISEDITDRVEAEARLVESLDAERQAVERLREVDQVKDAFVSSVSHELRTPITSILGYLEMLQDGAYGELAPQQRDAVQRVASNSARLLSLIDDLLTLSRLDEGGIAVVDRLVDLRTIVRAGCAVVEPSLDQRDLVIELDVPEQPVPFLGDRDMLERVVINLVSNAVKFTPDGGRVEVDLQVSADRIVLEVADTGIGIPRVEQERLFSRFFRSSLAQQQAIPGSGLGLSITHAIVEQHGGTVTVESQPGVGTRFRVELPSVSAPA